MKNSMYSSCLLLINFLLITKITFAQSIVIQPTLSQYNSSATPSVPTGIQYKVQNLNSGGFVIAYDFGSCKYSWTLTNGKEAVSNSTSPVKSGQQDIFIVWDNVNGNGNASVVITSVASMTCPLLGGNSSIQRAISVPIQHLADLDAIRLNGTPVSVSNLPCGTNSVTFSIPAPTTTNPSNAAIQYNWSISGGTITSGQGTSTIQVTPFPSSVVDVAVIAQRNDNPYITKSKQATLNRPTPTNLAVSTVNLVCPGQTVNATASATNATGFEWTSANGILVNGVQNTGVIGSTAGISGNADGTYSVRAYSSTCQTYSSSITRSVSYGPPQYPTIYVNNQPTQNTTFCAGTLQNIQPTPVDPNSNYNWYLNSGNPNNAYLTSYGSFATFNSYTAECYAVGLYITNACGTISTGLSFCAQDCFTSYSISPNPAKDEINVEFESVENATFLPDALTLLDEKTGKVVKSVDVQDAYKNKQFKNGNKIEIKVADLPRGIYYLHVKNSRRNDKQVDKIRILLE